MAGPGRYEETEEYRYFLELTQVPRPSGHLGKIQEYLVGFAKGHGLDYRTDAEGNVVIVRRGKSEPIVLQGHQDIVATTVPGHRFDFENSPLDVYVEDGWIHARNTTLGADDGAGLALMMCALTDPSLEGISLECLFTTDEETGLNGVLGMEDGWLEGRTLINLDSEDVNEITIGCAGSTDIEGTYTFERSQAEGYPYRITVSGLLGGHSAGMIDAGRGNAILILAGLLDRIKGVRIMEFDGGSAPNVIPMSAEAAVIIPKDIDYFEIMNQYRDEITQSLKDNDPGFTLTIDHVDSAPSFSAEDSSMLVKSILGFPNGVIDTHIYGVKTSSSLGMVRTVGDSVTVTVKPRSSDTVKINRMVDEMVSMFRDSGASCERPPVFPAWEESGDSELVKTAVELYREHVGREPKVIVTHGGLECSVIKDKHPGMGAVSLGPTILGAHTPDECMDLSTMTQMKEYLFRFLHVLAKV